MKKIFTLFIGAFMLMNKNSNAQFSENFDNDITSLSANCWQFSSITWTNSSPVIVNGTIYGITSGSLTTPYLNINSTSLTVSFKYKLSTGLGGSGVRSIEIGLADVAGAYTSLQTISMNSSSPTTVQNFNNTYTLGSACVRKLRITIAGSGGSVKVLFDDLSTSANALYGPTTYCNSAPSLAKDTFLFTSGVTGYGNVMLNDVEPDGETMTASLLTPSPDGIVVMNANGSFSFTPNPGFTGSSANFTYQVCDNGYEPICAATTVKLTFVENSPLPVKLISFQGNKNENKVSLQWAVATNETADRFEIERSLDGKDFTTAGIVMSTEKFGAESYSFKETVTSDKVFYRLKMYDNTRISEYSKILAFQVKSASNSNQIKIINNPATDKLTLSFNSSVNQPVEIKVYDISGRTQMTQKMNVYQGSNLISLPLNSSFKTGVYIVKINNGTELQMAKFVKQ